MEDALARSWKLFVAVAAVIGAYAFFEPYYVQPESKIAISGYRMVAGFDRLEQIGLEVAGVTPDEVDTLYGRGRLRDINSVVKSDEVTDLSRYRSSAHTDAGRTFVPIYFLAVALLVALAFYSLVERQLPTAAAWLTVLGGLWAIFGFVRTWRGVTPTQFELGTGAHLLILSGGLALIAGFGALIKEDPGGIFKNAPPREPDDDERAEEEPPPERYEV